MWTLKKYTVCPSEVSVLLSFFDTVLRPEDDIMNRDQVIATWFYFPGVRPPELIRFAINFCTYEYF
jgi:hypothetical protein